MATNLRPLIGSLVSSFLSGLACSSFFALIGRPDFELPSITAAGLASAIGLADSVVVSYGAMREWDFWPLSARWPLITHSVFTTVVALVIQVYFVLKSPSARGRSTALTGGLCFLIVVSLALHIACSVLQFEHWNEASTNFFKWDRSNDSLVERLSVASKTAEVAVSLLSTAFDLFALSETRTSIARLLGKAVRETSLVMLAMAVTHWSLYLAAEKANEIYSLVLAQQYVLVFLVVLRQLHTSDRLKFQRDSSLSDMFKGNSLFYKGDSKATARASVSDSPKQNVGKLNISLPILDANSFAAYEPSIHPDIPSPAYSVHPAPQEGSILWMGDNGTNDDVRKSLEPPPASRFKEMFGLRRSRLVASFVAPSLSDYGDTPSIVETRRQGGALPVTSEGAAEERQQTLKSVRWQ